MLRNITASETVDDALRAWENESRKQFAQDPTPENLAAHRRAFKAFADWVLRRKLPEDRAASGR